ncbi:MAG: asparagine synthase (glutamine-hydrolyzing) [Cytophagales bacterium]|nr:asparagine synthase (glutamine-hydrolyzing) [Cytophagales bacterium]
MKGKISTHSLIEGTEIISHRGPDDEGYLLWSEESESKAYAGKNTNPASSRFHNLDLLPEKRTWKVGFGHKRLSILDLSPAGHQPMQLHDSNLSITYNGEVYNYLELRKELEKLGHHFNTHTDTEVILKAWDQWGKDCLSRFNGMFAFVLLDAKSRKVYAVRDRFGVKPLYFKTGIEYFAFASEVKQLRTLPGCSVELNEHIVYDYLHYGWVDYNQDTFEKNIQQVEPGSFIQIDLVNNNYTLHKWYELQPSGWEGNFEEAIEQFYFLLKDSVALRMRSDVPVGSALSGGLDSSTIVSLMREVLTDQNKGEHLIKTITSCQRDKAYDEWAYAEKVAKKVNTQPHQVFPSFEKLGDDLDRFLWHMDYPFASTSQFSQWCVFEGASKAGLTVMIDGQGADEQLAGYGGNDMALYTGLLSRFKIKELIKEVMAYKQYTQHWPYAFVIGAIQHLMPSTILNVVPDKYRVNKQSPPSWLKFNLNGEQKKSPRSLRESLYKQVLKVPLPSLLRYEDRNSMAFSIESRVPFMDYRLIEFTLGLPEHFVYYRGERKYILRKAFKRLVPKEVLERKDKMGFVSAEELWLRKEGRDWFRNEIIEAGQNLTSFIYKDSSLKMVEKMANGSLNFTSSPWRILTLNRFIKMINR